MVTVGLVDCEKEEALCKYLARNSGVSFYPVKEVTPEKEIVCKSYCLSGKHSGLLRNYSLELQQRLKKSLLYLH